MGISLITGNFNYEENMSKPVSGKDKQASFFFATMTIIYMLFSCISAYLAPLGYWRNQMLGVVFYNESDPAGIYVANAITFFDRPSAYCAGHPGTPLELLLHLLILSYYGVSSVFGYDGPYYEFCAVNIHRIFFLAKVTMTALHLCSFFVLYKFADRILKDRSASVLSVLGYATSMPVLYYLTRVSVEPLIVIFFLLAFLGFWYYEDSIAQNNFKKGFKWLVVVGLATASGFFTKLHLLALLPLFMLLLVLHSGIKKRLGFLTILSGLGVLATSTAVCGTLWSLKVDWRKLYHTWVDYAPAKQGIAATGTINFTMIQIEAYLNNIVGYFVVLFNKLFSYSREGLYAVSELFFFVIAVIGVKLFYRRHRLYKVSSPLFKAVLMLPVIIYTSSFHYLFVYQAIAAVFFGYAMLIIIRRLAFEHFKHLCIPAAFFTVILLHSAAIYMAVESKIHDIIVYQRNVKPYYQALDLRGNNDKIFVVFNGRHSVGYHHVFETYYYRWLYSTDMKLFQEFHKIFKFIQLRDWNDFYRRLPSGTPGSLVLVEPEGIDNIIRGADTSDFVSNNEISGPLGPCPIEQLAGISAPTNERLISQK